MKPDTELRQCLDCSCFAARRAARLITQHYERHMRRSGLRVAQFTALTVLALAGPQALSQLAEQLSVERTTLTRNLRALLARGWVKETATDDRRVRVLAITPQGKAAAHAALPYWREAQKSIARRLGGDAIQALAVASEATARSSVGRTR
jgi:DNA-binding MarR family transcriptional regulator